jgi:hypothetical protein
MTIDRNKKILQSGIDSALEKMSSPRNLLKSGITGLSFRELYIRIVMEQAELKDEIQKMEADYSDPAVPAEVLEAIRFKAGDVIAFASAIVAKADAEIASLSNKQLVFSEFAT